MDSGRQIALYRLEHGKLMDTREVEIPAGFDSSPTKWGGSVSSPLPLAVPCFGLPRNFGAVWGFRGC